MEASRRGWWSYTDLAALWEGSDTPQVMMDAGKQTAKVNDISSPPKQFYYA